MQTEFIPAAGEITMFSTEWCGYCKRLKKMLVHEGIGYTEIDIERTPGTEELVAQLNGGDAIVPTVIFSDGTSATNPSIDEVKARLAA